MYQGNDMANSFYIFVSVFLFVSKFSWKKMSYYVDDYIHDFKKEYGLFISKFKTMNQHDNVVINDKESTETTLPNKILDEPNEKEMKISNDLKED